MHDKDEIDFDGKNQSLNPWQQLIRKYSFVIICIIRKKYFDYDPIYGTNNIDLF